MKEVVLDTSVVLKWFRTTDELRVAEASSLRRQFSGGELALVVPSLLATETLNVVARRWRWSERALVRFVRTVGEIGFDVREPNIETVARWAARGLTAYDATYVALAEDEGIPLITDDDELVALAPGVARSLRAEPVSGPDL